jgi:heptose I phosphotransferase
VAELFLREDFAAGGEDGEPLSADCRAADLLQWARRTAAQAAPGDIYRDKEGRKTLRFRRSGRSYFLKLHSGIGWGEVFKNLLQLRLPVPGAGNEYRAVMALQQIGVDTMSVAAYASVGRNPAARQSLIVTDDLVGTVSLEDYCADWAQRPPPFAVRLRLIRKLADSSRRMHGVGINHRDFYICHFHLDESTLGDPAPRCHLIDLHRAQLRRAVPRRWLEKDLAGLYFSAMDCGLTERDLLRFLKHYTGGGLRVALTGDRKLWRRVTAKAEQLYRREHGREPPPLVGGTR